MNAKGKERADHSRGDSGIELDRIELPDIPELRIETEPESKSSLTTPKEGQIIRLSTILEDLDKKMKSGNFLHTFTAQIEEINRMIRMKYASTKDIASVILKDVALSAKVLSIVNSSYYGSFSQKGITSISEAMVILGTEEVQQAASTLLLFEFMQDIAKSEMMKEKSLASLMRGMMAKDVAETAKYEERDEFQLVAMLYDIGEQIILFCDPEAYHGIYNFSESKRIGLEAASKKLLGASFGQIGQGVVSKWGFPPAVVKSIKPFKDFKKSPGELTSDELKCLVASFTNEMCSIDWRLDESYRSSRVEKIIRQYGDFLELGVKKADELLLRSMDRIEKHSKILKIKLSKSRFDRQSVVAPEDLVGVPESSNGYLDVSSKNMPGSPQEVKAPRAIESRPHEITEAKKKERNQWVKNQLFEIEKLLEGPFKVSEALHAIVSTIYKGFFFSKISICIVNKQSGKMAARFVLGDELSRFGAKFGFQVDETSGDLFNKALNTGVDIIVEDVGHKDVVSEVPQWYLSGGFATSLSIYPLVIKQKKVGMIYVDWESKDTHLFSNEVKQFMHQLKILTTMAIQKSRT